MTDFMWHQARRDGPAPAELLAPVLRSLFRCLCQRGGITNDLTPAVPTVPNWRLSSQTQFMQAEDVDCLGQGGDRSPPTGQRDYAIMLLVARQVFVRMRAPRRGLTHGRAVMTIGTRARLRPRLNPACKGAHLLRHSFAPQLLHNGASLTDIGERFRHHPSEMPWLYAHVDQGA
jgi:hypothetical protein